ncbi:NAD(P)-dependent oxidoreductase [Altererythrobacter sp. BO-6]|uniref:NAD-dependent epimerase/dehydratase family protein n=1 Tax=Altererythrobacter sp. BO-6 TaxID=2604537 RepID=UPI0013E1212C|nr:NAD(P)-dependent oxidoreductase [Altererythrobacter sp. BO-6]QIG53191.1 NAD(P)-dependent oxidoreductase [Altererythrobacter sp. BO-6]
MKVLLTGHMGYIGSVLAPKLLDQGHQVVGLDSALFEGCNFLPERAKIASVAGDVREFVQDPARANEQLHDIDVVIHLAALSNDPLGDYRPGLTQEINAQASIELARCAKRAGVTRFVFASSCSNYGASGDGFITEQGTLNPVTAYGRSKVEAEIGISMLADETFSPTFLRASTAYGLSPLIRMDLVVNNLTAWACTTGEVHLMSDGSPWRPIVHVEDIAAAYIATIEADRSEIHNEVFNVGQTTENYQIREIAEIVRDVVPGSKIGFSDEASPDVRNYRVDCNYIARKLHNFKPQWTCKRGVEQLFEAFTSNGLTFDQFNGPRFKRIAHMKEQIERGSFNDDLFPVREIVNV